MTTPPPVRHALPGLPRPLTAATAAAGLVAVLLAAAPAATAGGVAVPAAATAAAAPPRVMPLGDSITDGYNVPGGYRIELEDRLLDDGVAFDFVGSRTNGPSSLQDKDHEGHSGWRIDMLAGQLDGWLAEDRPDVVLLHIGTNDVRQDWDLSEAPERLGDLVDQITDQVPSATVLVATLTPLADGGDAEQVRDFNAAVPGVVRERAEAGASVRLVDMASALTVADLADGIHPDADGYDKMADVWFEALSDVLPDPAPTPTPTPTPTTPAPVTGPVLPAGSALASGQQLTSPDGGYRAVMQGDGNFVVYSGSRALWHSRTFGNPGARAVMQGDGNLVVYTSTDRALWSTRTSGDARTVLQDDGNLVVYRSDDRPLWSTGVDRPADPPGSSALLPGQQLVTGQGLRSPDGRYRLAMQGDGNAVVYAGSRALWSAGTAGRPGARLVLQQDGNVVVYLGGTPLWSTGTDAGARLRLQDDGNLVLYRADDRPLWSSGPDRAR